MKSGTGICARSLAMTEWAGNLKRIWLRAPAARWPYTMPEKQIMTTTTTANIQNKNWTMLTTIWWAVDCQHRWSQLNMCEMALDNALNISVSLAVGAHHAVTSDAITWLFVFHMHFKCTWHSNTCTWTQNSQILIGEHLHLSTVTCMPRDERLTRVEGATRKKKVLVISMK